MCLHFFVKTDMTFLCVTLSRFISQTCCSIVHRTTEQSGREERDSVILFWGGCGCQEKSMLCSTEEEPIKENSIIVIIISKQCYAI